ncbi:hypothetical protein HC752_24035 [Vibrio sp. S9_S30]|nr:hypothetical protein [Vibrio sp. S9_S30]
MAFLVCGEFSVKGVMQRLVLCVVCGLSWRYATRRNQLI